MYIKRPLPVNTDRMVAGVACALLASVASAQTIKPNVTVVNTAANPVPVTGTLNVGNAVVPVEVSNADPIPVAMQSSRVYRRWVSNFQNDFADVTFQAPAGKRIVITYISARNETTVESFYTFLRFDAGCPNQQSQKIHDWVVPTIAEQPFSGDIVKVQQLTETLTPGIAFEPGQCGNIRSGSSEAPILVLGYEEDAV